MLEPPLFLPSSISRMLLFRDFSLYISLIINGRDREIAILSPSYPNFSIVSPTLREKLKDEQEKIDNI